MKLSENSSREVGLLFYRLTTSLETEKVGNTSVGRVQVLFKLIITIKHQLIT